MTLQKFPYSPEQVRDRLRQFTRNNKKKIRIKFPFEKRMNSITFWISRFEYRYLTDKSYQMKIDKWMFMGASLILGIMLGVCLAMIYGIITYPF